MLGWRLTGAFFAAGFLVALLEPVAALELECAAGFFLAAGFFFVVTAAPDATREECLVRCLVGFFVTAAASAIDDIVKDAISATRRSFIALRIMAGTITRPTMNSLANVRIAVYNAIVATGRAPSAAGVARTLELDEPSVVRAFRELAAAHVIVLQPGSVEIAWAPPFSSVPTPFRVSAGATSWYAPCAWDAFGIPAALKRDAVIDVRCAWSREPIACGVADGRAYGDAVVHLLVPAAHFWDDIAYT